MTVVYEPIPQVDLDRIDFAAQAKKMPGFAHVPTVWAIDSGRETYLVCYAAGGSQIDMPALYGFGYKGLGIVGLVAKHKNEPDDPWCRIYEVSAILADEAIKPYLDDILPLIEESMACFSIRPYSGVRSVKVRFPVQHNGE